MNNASSLPEMNNPSAVARSGWLTVFAVLYIIVTNTTYLPIDFLTVGFGPLKLLMMGLATVMLFSVELKFSKAMVCGMLYLGSQFFAASLHPESWRWSTLLYSVGLVCSYVCMYNLIYEAKVFSVDCFIKLMKGLMLAYFVVCIVQQICIVSGITEMPLLNLYDLNRGIGCNSLSMEPSHFARIMLICYYCYVKCCEYKRGQGRFGVKELFFGEHKWVTLCFLWMMITMGSGTAYGCLILFSLYFVSKRNYGLMLPLLLAGYLGLQFLPQPEQMQRATSLINTTIMTRDVAQMRDVEGSGSLRIAPIINSLNADFTKEETWFGHGVDYDRSNNLVVKQQATLFDDYGFVFYLCALLLNFACAYRFFSLAAIFMIAGVGGGSGSNIYYAWALMVLMTCERYFYEQYHAGNLMNARLGIRRGNLSDKQTVKKLPETEMIVSCNE